MQRLGQTGLEVSRIGLGCMRMASLTEQETAKVLDTVVGQGINFFDHADIYGGGESEIRFAQGAKLAGLKRENLLLQSKCGIRKGYFDFSKEYILESVDGILKRLDTEYLDVLALHRPDALMEAEEVAEAFYLLKKQGRFIILASVTKTFTKWSYYSPISINRLQLINYSYLLLTRL